MLPYVVKGCADRRPAYPPIPRIEGADGIIEEAGEIEDASTLDAALVATQPCAARPNVSGDVHPFNLI
jgi:hypothetical protein